jgi:hypothetical protein
MLDFERQAIRLFNAVVCIHSCWPSSDAFTRLVTVRVQP